VNQGPYRSNPAARFEPSAAIACDEVLLIQFIAKLAEFFLSENRKSLAEHLIKGLAAELLFQVWPTYGYQGPAAMLLHQ
jgi:hypothetical protein